MKLATFSFNPKDRWSVDRFPELDSENTLVTVFGAPEYLETPTAIFELASAYPASKLVGCSTAGEISGSLVNDGSLSVAIAQFERSSIAIASRKIDRIDESQHVGEHLARQLYRPGLRNIFVLSDGLKVNGSALARGFNSVLLKTVLISGALAADGKDFQRTWVIRNRRPESGVVTAIGFYGSNLVVSHGSCGGWDGFGPERRITRSRDNILYELDGRSALSLYKEYLGELASGLPGTAMLFPLAIRRDAPGSSRLIRTVLGIDEAAQSLIFAGEIPKGHLSQLMRGNFEHLVDGARVAACAAAQARPETSAAEPSLAMTVSCVGRRLVLGERTEEETEAALANLPANTMQVGFYSYGEISPLAGGGADLHNQTITLTLLSEA